ncbi:g2009 [Coccomyxa elongata]
MRPTDSADLADARYEAYMQDIQPGVRRYNVFWHAFEGSNVLPSQMPLSCASGYQQVPASQDELQSKGYNRYHCYASSQIQLFEAYLALDATYSIQSCATIWDIPDPPFRNPSCGGQVINNQTNKGGCIPQDQDVMLDFQDFVNFVAEHYNSDTGGRFTHYIIWNEVANGDWFDPSPMINAKQATSQQDTNLWLDTYALMVRLAHDAIQRHSKAPTMLYISLDQIWEKPVGECPPYLPGLQHCHIGSLNVVRGMWERLGLSIDWSLAIHPYGNPTKADWPTYFHFADINRIAAFQVSMLRKAGAAEPQRWPQAMMAATEQGWPAVTEEQQMQAASYICTAHDIVVSSPYALFVTHNDFQAPFSEDRTGLVPRWTGRTLNNTDRMQSTTFAAYSASHPDVWNTDPSHFCCTMHQRGCPTSAGKAKAPAYASN